MNYDDMLGRIAVGAGLEKDEADRVTRAFFRILETRLGNEEAQELAAQLPTELQGKLAPTDPDVEELTFEEFLNRMADVAGIENARAGQAAHAVWRVLNETVPEGQLDDIRSQLPNEFVEMLDASGAA